MYEDVYNLIPEHLSSCFTVNSNILSYLTRQSSNYVTGCNLKIMADSIRFCGVKIWNSLNNFTSIIYEKNVSIPFCTNQMNTLKFLFFIL